MCGQDINKQSPIRGGRVMGLTGASLALLDTDLSPSLCIAFVIHLLPLLPLPPPPSHHSHQPPASLYERLLSGAQRLGPSQFTGTSPSLY